MTVAEIAGARAVSPNTIKSQLRSLFNKLGVTTRREAVTAGRRHGLI
jgi:LuxR family maltose regulon positive regulatory protein